MGSHARWPQFRVPILMKRTYQVDGVGIRITGTLIEPVS